MASNEAVKKYLAYWFQLGKAVLTPRGCKVLRPEFVIQGSRYSDEFEACWNQIWSSNLSDCYLEGTDQTIADLLTSKWEITDCARCEMPIPIRPIGLNPLACPCHDLPGWPDFETPAPRSPVNSTTYLNEIRDRLQRLST